MDLVTLNADVMNDDELIAKFMGHKWGSFERKHMDYQTDWNFLMVTVNKIESVLSTPGASVMVGWDHWNDQFDGTINTDIDVTYQIVVEFIKWYNKTPKP